MRTFIVGLFALAFSAPAFAGHHHSRPAHHSHAEYHARPAPPPRVAVRISPVHLSFSVGPWSVDWSPPPRPGYVWAGGYYARGGWHPGYWRPVGPPPGPDQVFVVGHWQGDDYVDGYWREPDQPGMSWQDGFYDEDGHWIEGGWVPEGGVDVVYFEDRGDDWDDSAEQDVPLAVPADGSREVHAAPPQW